MRDLRRTGLCLLAIAVLSAPLVVAAVAPAAGNDDALIAVLRADWVRAINTRDLEGLIDLYAEGSVLMPQYVPPQLGREAIGNWYREQFAKIDAWYTYSAKSLRFDGHWAFEEWTMQLTLSPRGRGRVELLDDVVQAVESGARVYRKDETGRWKIDRELWDSDNVGPAR